MAVDYTKLLDGNSLKAIRTYLSTNYQPLHANLTSIAALSTSTTGLIKMTNGVASFDTTTYAPAANPTFTGTVTLPTTVKIGTLTTTGLVKYTNGVLSVDTNSYVKANNAITGATKCKITYDSKGLVTAGANLAASDIPDLSGTYVTLSGAQTISGAKTFKGVVTFTSATSGSGSSTIEHYYNPNGDSPINEFRFSASVAIFNAVLKTSTARIEKIYSYANSLVSGNPNCLVLGDSESGSYILANGAYDSYSTLGNNYSGIMFKTLYQNQSGGGYSLSTYGLKVPNTRGYTENRIIATTTDLTAYVANSTKGQANGVASLDANGKIPTSQLPDSIVGQMEYKGTWEADTGLTITPQKGWYYICSKAGTKNPDKSAGPASGYDIGDWAVYNGSSWDKIDNSDDLSGTVRYDVAQSLNATQKTQARTNIGAQAALATQTAYSAKGSAYKVPQITTNTLGQVTLITEIDIASASINDTVGGESITVATSASSSKTLNVVTRNTAQTITAAKAFLFTHSGSGTTLATSINVNLDGIEVSAPSGNFSPAVKGIRVYSRGSSYGIITTSGWDWIGFTSNDGGVQLSRGNYGSDANKSSWTSPTQYNYSFPSKTGTVALVDDIEDAVGNVYTEQEALAILNGTAS